MARNNRFRRARNATTTAARVGRVEVSQAAQMDATKYRDAWAAWYNAQPWPGRRWRALVVIAGMELQIAAIESVVALAVQDGAEIPTVIRDMRRVRDGVDGVIADVRDLLGSGGAELTQSEYLTTWRETVSDLLFKRSADSAGALNVMEDEIGQFTWPRGLVWELATLYNQAAAIGDVSKYLADVEPDISWPSYMVQVVTTGWLEIANAAERVVSGLDMTPGAGTEIADAAKDFEAKIREISIELPKFLSSAAASVGRFVLAGGVLWLVGSFLAGRRR